MLRLIENAKKYLSNIAIVSNGMSYTYETLLKESQSFAMLLLDGESNLKEARVGFMVNPGFDYVKVQWAIWQAGGIATPLCISHPMQSIQYVLEDTEASIVVISASFELLLSDYTKKKNIKLIIVEDAPTFNNIALPDISIEQSAMILYTSGTTNKPKGVVTTHNNLEAQIETLVEAWEWSNKDYTLCVLPLHHVHGIINVTSCAMWSGATCEFISEFSAEIIYQLFMQGKINVFMAVPTIYFKLIAYWETLASDQQKTLHNCMQQFRLMVCGSAALPISVMEKWKQVSGHTLLERYGMTEIGMAISNPYDGERKAGYVGIPLLGVQIKLADENYQQVATSEAGEILVKGNNVFKGYWNKPEETKKEFTDDGWFKTGDIAIQENGYYKIMGRNSVDIIKSGGYKISALEIEETLRTHESIDDCAVVGIADEQWGELIVAAIVLKDLEIESASLNNWMRERIPTYKTPRKYLIVNELPRNAMGKVTKNDVKKLFI